MEAGNFVINQTKISEQVYDFLRGAILNGRFAPGERLNLDELVDQLGISKMPLKEAVGRLAAEGLINVQSRRGTYVNGVDARELAETFEVRRALEILAGELAVERITGEGIKQLYALIEDMEASASRHDVALHLEKNFEFHGLIVNLSGNQKLAEVYQRLRMPIQIVGVHYRSENWIARIEQEQREHRAIVRALEKRDADAVTRAIASHLKRGKASLIEDMERSEKQSP